MIADSGYAFRRMSSELFRSAANVTAKALLLAVAGVTAGPVDRAIAQVDGNVDDRLLACSEIADTAERAACFDDVVRNMRQDGERANGGAAEAASMPASADRADTESVAVPPVDTPGDAARDEPAMQIETRAGEVEEEFVEFTATIVQSNKSGINHFVVELDNGQVWEETDGSRRPRLPRVGEDVRIYEGRFGGFRMKIGEDNRISWVRRLR
jgi:hypothetical protein